MPPYNPPVDALYCEVTLPTTMQWSWIWRIVGAQGSVLKAITHQSGADYLWWNQEKGVIEIWAYSLYALHDAYYRVSDRVQWFEKEQEKHVVIFGTFNDSVFYQKKAVDQAVDQAAN